MLFRNCDIDTERYSKVRDSWFLLLVTIELLEVNFLKNMQKVN